MTGIEAFQAECAREALNSELMSTELDQDGNFATHRPSNKNMTYRSIGIESFFQKGDHKAGPKEDAGDNLREL